MKGLDLYGERKIKALVDVLKSLELLAEDINPVPPFSEDENLKMALSMFFECSLSDEVKKALDNLQHIFPGRFKGVFSKNSLKNEIWILIFGETPTSMSMK